MCNAVLARTDALSHIVCYVPRPPRHHHAIRRLRQSIGKSQKDFARLIGLSASALQRIELGSLKLSSKVAQRISVVTGVRAKCLFRRNKPLLAFDGTAYASSEFDKLQRRYQSKAISYECEYMAQELETRVAVLLRAAVTRKVFDSVLSDLWEEVDKIRVTYGLAAVARDRLARDPTRPRAEWDDVCSPGDIVWFDDVSTFSLPMEATGAEMVWVLEARGNEGPAYGRSNNGVVFGIERRRATAQQLPRSVPAAHRSQRTQLG